MLKKNIFQSKNPFFSNDRIATAATATAHSETGYTKELKGSMTVQGAVNKSILLGVIMLFTAFIGYNFPISLVIWGGAIGGLVVVIIAAMKPHLSPTLAPLYAALQGLFVGGISAMYASLFSGIVFQAVTLTMAVFFVMLFLYKTGIIKVTQKLRAGIVMATGAILVVYLINFVMHMFGSGLPYLHSGGTIGILISLAIIAIAAMNLLLDFDNFEKGEEQQAPTYMEWFAAMGLLITLVWLYIEILRLLSILYSRD